MAQLLNSGSNSPVRVGRKVKKIVSQISSLIDKFPSCCWYDGRWYDVGGGRHNSYVFETECRGIELKEDGVYFYFDDPFGQTRFRKLPYGPKLYSRLRNIQQKIWIGMYCIVSKGHVMKTIPSWALKRGCYPHI